MIWWSEALPSDSCFKPKGRKQMDENGACGRGTLSSQVLPPFADVPREFPRWWGGSQALASHP